MNGVLPAACHLCGQCSCSAAGIRDVDSHLRAADDLPDGFQRIEGKYVDVITDLPLDAEMRSLPVVFDAAVPRWCDEFDVDLAEVADWHVEAFVMLRREEFQKAGFIPSKLPPFPYGFQYGNQLWSSSNQVVLSSAFAASRRHALVHESQVWQLWTAVAYGGAQPNGLGRIVGMAKN